MQIAGCISSYVHELCRALPAQFWLAVLQGKALPAVLKLGGAEPCPFFTTYYTTTK